MTRECDSGDSDAWWIAAVSPLLAAAGKDVPALMRAVDSVPYNLLAGSYRLHRHYNVMLKLLGLDDKVGRLALSSCVMVHRDEL